MTFGQLFTAMHPDVRAIENGSCVWLFMDEVNHYTIATKWWNQEVTGYALELLKAQNPRVLAQDDIEHAEVVWFEARRSLYIEPMLTRNKRFADESADWFQYGRDWRCWTAKPTDEQRKAVKWDAAD